MQENDLVRLICHHYLDNNDSTIVLYSLFRFYAEYSNIIEYFCMLLF